MFGATPSNAPRHGQVRITSTRLIPSVRVLPRGAMPESGIELVDSLDKSGDGTAASESTEDASCSFIQEVNTHDAMGECFVCMEENSPAPPSPCKCKGRFLHPHCHLKLIEQTHAMTCSVCTAEYYNLSIKVSTIKRPSTPAIWISSLLFICIFCLGFAAILRATCGPCGEPCDGLNSYDYSYDSFVSADPPPPPPPASPVAPPPANRKRFRKGGQGGAITYDWCTVLFCLVMVLAFCSAAGAYTALRIARRELGNTWMWTTTRRMKATVQGQQLTTIEPRPAQAV